MGESPSSSSQILICREAAEAIDAPIISSYNDRIRPLLDCVDNLRRLKIMQEGIQLPTIVVVGDQSSGKSSVLESLAGISLPRGQGICTRVPLIMRLQNQPNLATPELQLEFNGKTVPTDEAQIEKSIIEATEEIAGHGKGISHTPLTLAVKKNGVPDLTMVDLPGITRVPVHGQPEDIYEQISNIIMEYITPEESIILNVLSAASDFTTNESIRMSQKVDKTGERTLAVVTKADKAPEGLLEKVTADDVRIGLGYVCVRNRIGDESYELARNEEAKLFDAHPLLSKINKSMVSIPVLAQKLVRIQATIISKCLPEIIKKINDKLAANAAELNQLPPKLNSLPEAMTAFMRILGSSKDSLKKILLLGEFDEYPEEKDMHCSARLVEMLNRYSAELTARNPGQNKDAVWAKDSFLVEEISALDEAKGIQLQNFLPRGIFLNMLQKNVKAISAIPRGFIDDLWDYIEAVLIKVLIHHSENYPQLQSSTRRAAQNLIAKKKSESAEWVEEIIGMETHTDYTCNPEYITTCNKLMEKQGEFMETVKDPWKSKITIAGIGEEIETAHLKRHQGVAQQAFDLKMRMVAYWNIVLMRLVDSMALHIQFSIHKLVTKEMEEAIVADLMAPHGGGIERMLDESPTVAEKRYRLSKSVKLLKESKNVVANIIDRITVNDDL
nr:dynamin-related protein 4C-like [Ipomoea trifida]